MGKNGGFIKSQLVWGVIVGVITFALMGGAYYLGTKQSKDEEVKGEVTEVTDREVEIAIRSDCSSYEEGHSEVDGKIVDKYCVSYSEGKSAFDFMKQLDEARDDYSFAYDESKFGVFITSINNYHPDIDTRFWGFLVNDEMSLVGVDGYKVNEGDNIGFKVEEVKF